jgi:rhodanese-related sulfurtransferase
MPPELRKGPTSDLNNDLFMLRTVIIPDLKWSLIFAALGLALALMWQWPVIHQGFQGALFPRIKELERQEAARRLEGIRTFDLPQVYALHQQGEALLIDARPPAEYRELHIEGAVNLTAKQLESGPAPDQLKKVDLHRAIIVYCANEDCHASLQVAELLQSRGFTQVAVFLGGFRAWDEAGYPVDVSR